MATTAATAALVRRDPATIVNGTEYYFTVKAVTAVGAGPASNQASATPEPVPGAPQDLVATAGGGSAKLTWDAPASPGGSPVTGYDLYQGTSPGGEGGIPVSLPAGSTAYTVTGLTSTVPYYFYVAAINGSGTGLGSNEASAVPTGAPGAPTGLKAIPGDLQVALSWSKPANDGGSAITGYTVLWRTATSSTPTQVTLGATVTSYTVTGLTNGTAYQFAVEAVNSSGPGRPPVGRRRPDRGLRPLAPSDLKAMVQSTTGYSSLGRVGNLFSPGRAPGQRLQRRAVRRLRLHPVLPRPRGHRGPWPDPRHFGANYPGLRRDGHLGPGERAAQPPRRPVVPGGQQLLRAKPGRQAHGAPRGGGAGARGDGPAPRRRRPGGLGVARPACCRQGGGDRYPQLRRLRGHQLRSRGRAPCLAPSSTTTGRSAPTAVPSAPHSR